MQGRKQAKTEMNIVKKESVDKNMEQQVRVNIGSNWELKLTGTRTNTGNANVTRGKLSEKKRDL